MTWVPPRPRWFRVLLGLTMLAAGIGMFLISEDLVPRVQGNNVPVNTGATDKTNIASHNSPTLVRNPTRRANLVVVSRVDTPRFGCALYASSDSGATWKRGNLGIPETPACFTPDAAFGPDGILYVSYVTLRGDNNVPEAVWVSRSNDGGASFSPAVKALGANALHVRLSTDAAEAGHLRLTWVQAAEVGPFGLGGGDSPVMFTSSTDGGATWGPPVRVSSPSRARVIGPTPAMALGREGSELVTAYLDLRDDDTYYRGVHLEPGAAAFAGRWSLVVARSADSGATWQEIAIDDKLVPTARFTTRFPQTPSLAVDPARRRVYVAFADGRLGDADVWIWASEDAGAAFSAPRRVNDTEERDGGTQTLPALAVAPGGRLDVIYYDRRADPGDILTEVSFQSSFDNGSSFRASTRISDRAFDSRVGFGGNRGVPEVGSRLGLVAVKDQALAVWADSRAGSTATNKQDLAKAVVKVPAPSALRQPLRYLGPPLAAGGLVVLVLSRRRREERGLAAASTGRRKRGRRRPALKPVAPVTDRPPPLDGRDMSAVADPEAGDGAPVAQAEEVVDRLAEVVEALALELAELGAMERPRLLGKVEQEQRRLVKAQGSLEEARKALAADDLSTCGRAVLDADRALTELGHDLNLALTRELAEGEIAASLRSALQANLARRTELEGELADERDRQNHGLTSRRTVVLMASEVYKLEAERLSLAVQAVRDRPPVK